MVYLRQALLCHSNHIQLFNLYVKMKKFYPSTLCAIIAIFFSAICTPASAQVPTTYTAVLPGNWHTPGPGPGIWASAEPPMNCVSCTIVLNVAPNQTVNLNAHVALSGNSHLVIGGGSNGTSLFIGNSGASDTTDSYSVNLVNDGTNSTVQLINGNSFINVAQNTSGAGNLDGIFTSTTVNGSYLSNKAVGYAPSGFVNGTTVFYNGAASNQSVQGAKTLSSDGTLPIILSDFTGVVNDGAVDLAWTTAMEVNSQDFVIQRSADAGTTWTNLATIAAHGNSATPINYTYTDNKPVQGTAEYRLQLVDKGGLYAYSSVISVRIGIVTAVNIYPNPARDYVNVTLAGAAGESMLVRLFNSAGQLLQEKNIANAGGTTVPFAVSNYPEGNYLIVVSASDGSRQINKLVITK